MLDVLTQLVVLLLAVLVAAVKSLRFDPTELTDYELDRQVKQGRDAAIAEARLRRERPILLALQQITILLLTIVIIVTLRSTFDFIGAIFFAIIWLLVAEFLATRGWLRSFAEEFADRNQMRILKVADFLRPVLRFITFQQFIDTRRATFYSKDELMYALENDHGVLTKEEITLVRQALSYMDKQVKEVMTPRSVVITAEASDTLGPVVLDKLHKSGQSRFPVVEKNFDHVVGMLYMHDLVPLPPKAKHVKDAMRPKVYYVNQDKNLEHVLHAFLRTKHHLFIVVNEFEEATGVISIEDILEQIIGRNIVDEFDQYQDLRAVAKLVAAKRQKSNTGKHI